MYYTNNTLHTQLILYDKSTKLYNIVKKYLELLAIKNDVNVTQIKLNWYKFQNKIII